MVIDATLRDGSLRQAAAEKNIPMLLYEGGEALRFDEVSIRAGVRGIIRVMDKLKMIRSHHGTTRDGKPRRPQKQHQANARPLNNLGARTVQRHLADRGATWRACEGR